MRSSAGFNMESGLTPGSRSGLRFSLRHSAGQKGGYIETYDGRHGETNDGGSDEGRDEALVAQFETRVGGEKSEGKRHKAKGKGQKAKRDADGGARGE